LKGGCHNGKRKKEKKEKGKRKLQFRSSIVWIIPVKKGKKGGEQAPQRTKERSNSRLKRGEGRKAALERKSAIPQIMQERL